MLLLLLLYFSIFRGIHFDKKILINKYFKGKVESALKTKCKDQGLIYRKPPAVHIFGILITNKIIPMLLNKKSNTF